MSKNSGLIVVSPETHLYTRMRQDTPAIAALKTTVKSGKRLTLQVVGAPGRTRTGTTHYWNPRILSPVLNSFNHFKSISYFKFVKKSGSHSGFTRCASALNYAPFLSTKISINFDRIRGICGNKNSNS